jgi:tetratricopeptide (TPR) repeat protein
MLFNMLHTSDCFGKVLSFLAPREGTMLVQVDRFMALDRETWATDPAKDMVKAAQKLEKKKRWSDARMLYELSNILHPKSDTLLKLAEASGRVLSSGTPEAKKEQRKGSDVAREFADRAKKLEPTVEVEAKAWHTIGKVLGYQGDQQEGIAAFERSLECKEDAEVRLLLGRTLRERGQNEPALIHVTRALEMVENGEQDWQELTSSEVDEIHGSIFNELGMLQLLGGKADEAALSIRKAAEKYPKYLLNLATSMSAQGDIDGAVLNLEQALESHKEDSVILGNLAGLKMRQADSLPDEATEEARLSLYREAEHICHRVIANGAGNGEDEDGGSSLANLINAHMNLSQLCALRNSWDNAIEHSTEAVRLQLEDDANPERFQDAVAAHFIGPDGIPKVSPREHHTGHLHFTLAHMMLHRLAGAPEQHGTAEHDDPRLVAHHLAQAIVKYTELEKEYGDFIEGVVPKVICM